MKATQEKFLSATAIMRLNQSSPNTIKKRLITHQYDYLRYSKILEEKESNKHSMNQQKQKSGERSQSLGGSRINIITLARDMQFIRIELL